MKHFLLLSVFLLTIGFVSHAQNNHSFCGMHGENLELQRQVAWEMQKRIRSANAVRKVEDTYFIPVKFHLVADDDGEGRILEHYVLEQLCWLNEAYADYDIQFYLKDASFNYIDNSVIFEGPSTQGGELRMRQFRDEGAMNVFLTDRADTGGGSIGTTLGFYSRNRDWIVIRNDQMTDGYNSVIGHEVGHFFSLLHPHNGWDSEPWEEARHGNPVSIQSIGGVEIECQDGSNCETAGDFLCDTPPDYNFGFGWPDCTFTSQITDPCGDIVQPMEINFMGYFLNCSDFSYIMTEQQAEQMIENIESSSRDYLDNDFMAGPEPGLAGLLSPAAGSVLNRNENIGFDWEDASNAVAYLFQVSRGNAFRDDDIEVSRIVSESYTVVDELEPNRFYHYRVIPISENYTCPRFSELEVKQFRTGLGTSTTELETGFRLSLVEQVLQRGQNIQLHYDTDRQREFSWQIFNVNGAIVAQDEAVLRAGGSTFIFDNNSVNRIGTYIIRIQSEGFVRSFKILVQ
jgi:hypothetical protein